MLCFYNIVNTIEHARGYQPFNSFFKISEGEYAESSYNCYFAGNYVFLYYDETFVNDYNKYKDNILREIEIITPQVIVFCAGNKAIYDDLKKNVNCKYIIDMYHPSYQYVSDEKYIEKFKEEFEKLLEK